MKLSKKYINIIPKSIFSLFSTLLQYQNPSDNSDIGFSHKTFFLYCVVKWKQVKNKKGFLAVRDKQKIATKGTLLFQMTKLWALKKEKVDKNKNDIFFYKTAS